MIRSYALAVMLAASPLVVRAAKPDAGPSAAQILQKAESKARAEHKNILLEFGASWCVNCKLYDRMLNDDSMRAILDPHFVFAYMDTGEHAKDTRHTNTPGGVEFENSIGGKDAGWPFLVILDSEGKPIVDSNRPSPKSKAGDNIGYPVLPQEVDWFIVMLQRGAPSLSRHDLDRVH
ncbi:MAG TPA: thioredoxin family protein, partial [Terracidiphilus sp.]